MQDGAHFTATQLVRAGISYNYLKSRSAFVFTLYIFQEVKKERNCYKTHYNRDNKVTLITAVWACTENGRK
jgi:hypothetical protein